MRLGHKTVKVVVLLLCVAQLGILPTGRGWSVEGHLTLTTLASGLLPENWRQFFQYYGWLINETSAYPDTLYRDTDPNEGPRHYIDLEIWDPNKPSTGTLPQAVDEFSKKMQAAIETKDWNEMFLDAGRVAHYMADVTQPYHTTVDYNPRTRNGTGLHQVLDSSLVSHMNEFRFVNASEIEPMSPVRNVTQFVLDIAIQSHSFLPAINTTLIEEGLEWSPKLTKIIENRTNTAISAIARLWFTAIANSGSVPPDLPSVNRLSIVIENMSLNQKGLSLIRLRVVDEIGVKTYGSVVLSVNGFTYRAQVANVVPPLGEYIIILGPGEYAGKFVFTAQKEGYVSGNSTVTVLSMQKSMSTAISTSSKLVTSPTTVLAVIVMMTALVLLVWYRRKPTDS